MEIKIKNGGQVTEKQLQLVADSLMRQTMSQSNIASSDSDRKFFKAKGSFVAIEAGDTVLGGVGLIMYVTTPKHENLMDLVIQKLEE